MKRFYEKKLDTWLNKKNRKPLVIRGARQVGKSTLVRNFVHSKGWQLCEINLEKHIALDSVFASFNIKLILKELEALLGYSINGQKQILFLD